MRVRTYACIRVRAYAYMRGGVCPGVPAGGGGLVPPSKKILIHFSKVSRLVDILNYTRNGIKSTKLAKIIPVRVYITIFRCKKNEVRTDNLCGGAYVRFFILCLFVFFLGLDVIDHGLFYRESLETNSGGCLMNKLIVALLLLVSVPCFSSELDMQVLKAKMHDELLHVYHTRRLPVAGTSDYRALWEELESQVEFVERIKKYQEISMQENDMSDR